MSAPLCLSCFCVCRLSLLLLCSSVEVGVRVEHVLLLVEVVKLGLK